MDYSMDEFQAQSTKIIAETRYKNAKHYAETCPPEEFWAAAAQMEDARRRLWTVNQRELDEKYLHGNRKGGD